MIYVLRRKMLSKKEIRKKTLYYLYNPFLWDSPIFSNYPVTYPIRSKYMSFSSLSHTIPHYLSIRSFIQRLESSSFQFLTERDTVCISRFLERSSFRTMFSKFEKLKGKKAKDCKLSCINQCCEPEPRAEEPKLNCRSTA